MPYRATGVDVGARQGVRSGIAGWLGSRSASTLLALMAIFTMGPLVLRSSLSVNSTYSALTDASNHRLTDASALAAAYVNTQMTSLAAADDSYAHQPTLIAALSDGNHLNYDKPAILTTLNIIRAIQTNSFFAGIVDAAGTYWGDQNPVGPASALGQNFSVRDWYQGTARTGKPYVSSAYTSSDLGHPIVVAISDPVIADGRYASKGKVLGILVVGYELGATQRLFSDFARNQGVAIEVTDQKGVVVALSGAAPTKLVSDSSAGVAAALKGKSSLGRVLIGGEDDFAAYSPVAGVGWTVLTALPASVALADANRLRDYVVAITIVLLALLAGTKITLYLILHHGQADNLALTGANTYLERRVAARTVELEATNRKLNAANRHKTTFLANMSHELRTPLNSILGFSELLIDSTDGQFPVATRNRFLEQIHSSGKHLLGLINDILDLSKIEAGQMELRLQTVTVDEVVNQVANTVEPLVAQKRIHLEVSGGNAGQILADEAKVTQMILNLVSNAIKFTPEGGTVTIKATRGTDRLEIEVSDTGIGIAQQDIRRVFREFQQVESGASRQQQGTGLGLALTRSFAVLHGGDVRLESELGKGSRFTIELPFDARVPDRVSGAPSAGAANATRDLTLPLILVVEDDPAAAELLVRQIQRGGFRTEIVRTGVHAVAMAKELKPAAITLDILLPDLDGWEVLTRLKRDEATSDIPVIVISVVDNPERGKALGALDYFVKPVEARELINRLSRFNIKHKSGSRQTSILVVDDEAANREWLKEVLEPAGFKVLLAKGGQEAIQLAIARKPDVVMLDLLMPEVDGFDVVEALKEFEATKAIPIMVLTAKRLTEADTNQLNGHVSTILRRGSTGAVDLVGHLQAVLNKRAEL
jgi:signal transduction histidine kinase/CheY-like chemotaxis protein